MPKVYLAINDITSANINSTIGSSPSDLTFTFKSSTATLGTINDNANVFADGSDNGGKLLQLWVEVKNNTVSPISFGINYFIQISDGSNTYFLRFPEDTIAPLETEVYYFDIHGVPFYDKDLTYPATVLHSIEDFSEITDNQDDRISNYLLVDNIVNLIDYLEDYRMHNLSESFFLDQDSEEVSGLLILQELGIIKGLVFRGTSWLLKTATAINWRLI